jgi:hypothetical protein
MVRPRSFPFLALSCVLTERRSHDVERAGGNGRCMHPGVADRGIVDSLETRRVTSTQHAHKGMDPFRLTVRCLIRAVQHLYSLARRTAAAVAQSRTVEERMDRLGRLQVGSSMCTPVRLAGETMF